MNDSKSNILPSQGVGFCDFPIYEDPDLDLVAFNDLGLVEGWATTLRIEGIRQIVLYQELDDINGIELVYFMSDGNFSPRITHGVKTSKAVTIDVSVTERVIAAFVGIDRNEPKAYKALKSLRFTKTDYDTGEVTTEGITCSLKDIEYKAAFGEVCAFRGTKIRGGGGQLVTLGVQTRFYGPATRDSVPFKHPIAWLPPPAHGHYLAHVMDLRADSRLDGGFEHSTVPYSEHQ